MSLGTLAAMMFAAEGPGDTASPTVNLDQVDVENKGAEQTPPGVGVAILEEIREPLEYSNQDERLVNTQQYLVSPIRPEGGGSIYMITVVLRASGDKTRDVLRLRRIHGTIMSFPGNDRFAFHVFERGRGYLVEFPNFTTGMCNDLVSKLRMLVGTDNVRVEPITFL